MKLKDGFMLKEVAGNYIVIPVGQVDFTAMITVNETGAFLWDALQKDTTREQLIGKMTAEYEIDRATAAEDIDRFLGILTANNLME